jgi:hypothetical protein
MKKDFINIIERIASREAFDAYLRIKNDLKPKKVIPTREARALINQIKSNNINTKTTKYSRNKTKDIKGKAKTKKDEDSDLIDEISEKIQELEDQELSLEQVLD